MQLQVNKQLILENFLSKVSNSARHYTGGSNSNSSWLDDMKDKISDMFKSNSNQHSNDIASGVKHLYASLEH